MPEVLIRFHGCLVDLLPARLGEKPSAVTYKPGDTLKNLIEARGVPHTEVGLVTVNGVTVPLSYQVRAEDCIQVYPVSPQEEGARIDGTRVDGGAYGDAALDTPGPRFMLDVHLGTLAKDLRALGFDAVWEAPFDDAALAERAGREGRVLLTRDRALLMRRAVTAGYLVRSRHTPEQLQEIVGRFGLAGRVRPFSRCLTCNCELVGLPREEAKQQVPELVFRLYDIFRRCPSCRKVFWKGTHWENMKGRLGPLLGHGD